MTLSTKLLQWNVGGMISKWPCVKPFLVNSGCDIMCIQETHFFDVDKYDFNIPYFTQYGYCVNSDWRQGGVCIYVKNKFPHYQIPLQSTLQAVACSVRVNILRITICSLYLPPNETLNALELESLIQQLPNPFVICTDANSRHVLWGADRCDRRGLIWERLIRQYGLHVLNDGEPTRMDSSTGLDSRIDITVSSASVAQYFTWTTDSALHDSDHFPIYATIHTGPGAIRDDLFYGWNLDRANWDAFREQCTLKFDEEIGVENCMEMTETIIQAANLSIPKKTGQSKYSCPWWTPACREAIAARKRALNRFRRNKSTTLLLEYKRLKAKARTVIRGAKKDSWEKLLSSFNHRTPMSQLWEILRKFTRKDRINRPLPILKVQDEMVDDPVRVTNMLGEYFSEISSVHNYTTAFRHHMAEIQRQGLDFDSDNTECYNEPLTITELNEYQLMW